MLDLDALRARYRQITDAEPEGLWFATGRVNIIGEHTDYNDGFVLPFAVPQGVSVGPCAQFRQRARMRAEVVLPQPRGPLNR